MKQYLDLVQEIMDTGTPRPNRTGERAIGIFGATLKFDLTQGFPILSTKRVPFKAVVGELLAFLAGSQSAETFRHFGCNIWDANANDPGKPGHENRWLNNSNRKGVDDLGRIYGAQWRDWQSPVPAGANGQIWALDHTDQIAKLMDGLVNDPFGRRHVVTAWNPGELDQMALPPCHMFFQVYIRADEYGHQTHVDLQMYQRSVDVFLGLPFNIASYAALTHMIAHCLDLKPGALLMNLGDTHIYESHIPEMLVQLRREPSERRPTLEFRVKADLASNPEDAQWVDKDGYHPDDATMFGMKRLQSLDDFQPDNFKLHHYVPMESLKGRMAV